MNDNTEIFFEDRRRSVPVVVPSPTASDPRLSYRALGVLTRLLALPAGQSALSAADLSPGRPESAAQVRSALTELARAGYCRLGDGSAVTGISDTPRPEWAAAQQNDGGEGDGR